MAAFQSFRDWLLSQESSPTTRALNAPWAYPALYVGGNPFSNYYSPRMVGNYKKMVDRDEEKKPPKRRKGGSKKKGRAPDTSVDRFVGELDALKKDLDLLGSRPKGSKPPEEKEKKSSGAAEDAAKDAASHLAKDPAYYSRQSGSSPSQGKVRRQDAIDIARGLGIDFSKVDYSREDFRRAIEAEMASRRARPGSLRGRVDGGRLGRGD